MKPYFHPSVKASATTGGLMLLIINALRSSGVEITPEWAELLIVAVPLLAAWAKGERPQK